jgi:hypothetical protein
MVYQLGWTTLPGLRGLSVSEFRATPTSAPDNERGVAIEFANEEECGAFLKRIETELAARRFTNTADAFDTVKTWIVERAGSKGDPSLRPE